MSLVDTLTLMPAQAAGGEPNALMSMLPIILMFVILYFLMIRPQMKRQKDHKKMVELLSKGDEVILSGGMLGKISKVSDSYITLEIGLSGEKPVETIVQRSAVTSVLPKGTIKSL
ncbi:MAG TPA: preprotein translocase subunit YajC [Castellaniella sp.]|uniref:preprotein translocase subunit YajC n=1 Tax=Castellaniella sp. TaxID=1955812 RepID=UPI002F21DCFF